MPIRNVPFSKIRGILELNQTKSANGQTDGQTHPIQTNLKYVMRCGRRALPLEKNEIRGFVKRMKSQEHAYHIYSTLRRLHNCSQSCTVSINCTWEWDLDGLRGVFWELLDYTK
jgi:hypothetical protein